MPGTTPLPPVNHPHGGPPWLLLLLLHTPPPLRVHPLPPFLPPAALEPSLLPSVYNQPLFLPFPFALALGSRAYDGQPLDTSGLSWGLRETGAGILNSKYLSRRRGAGRRPDKRVERVQARMGRLGWESSRSRVWEIFLERASRESWRHFYSHKDFAHGCFPIYPPFSSCRII